MPSEILDYASVKTPVHSQMDSIFSDQQLSEIQGEYQPTPPPIPRTISFEPNAAQSSGSPIKFTRTSMPSQAFGSNKPHQDESFDHDDLQEMFGGCSKDGQSSQGQGESATQATEGKEIVVSDAVSTSEREQLSAGEKTETDQNTQTQSRVGSPSCKPSSSEGTEVDFDNTLMFDDGLDKIKDAAGNFNQSGMSMFMDCTSIQGISSFGLPSGEIGYESTANDTQGGLLHLLNRKEPQYCKQLFPEAIELFRQLPKSQNPCRKLYIFASSMATALKEMRRVYSEITPDVETKVKVQMQDLLAVLIYVIAQANIPDLVTEYKIMKVYFLLNREYNHTLLVSLLKSAIKSINKVGVFLTKTMAQ